MRRVLLISVSFLLISAVLFAGGQGEEGAGAEAYPSDDIEIVVPAGVGGDTDTTARYLAKEMEEILDVSIAIKNIKGAAGAAATDDVVNSPADGYKAIYFHTDIIVSNLMGVSPYKWDETFEIAGIPSYVSNFGLFTYSDAPFDNVEELIEYAENETVKYATDTGSINQVLGRVIQAKAGVKFNEIDMGDASDRVSSLKGELIELVSLPYPVANDYVENGDFKCLGIYASERNEFLPEVPTLAEQGLDVQYTKFFFVGFKKGTPQEVIDTFTAAMKEATETERYKESMTNYLMVPRYLDPEEAFDFMKEQEEISQDYIDMIN